MRQIERTDERPMRGLSDVLRPKREPEPDERAIIEQVWAMATEYASLPPMRRSAYREEVRKLTTGRERHLATRFTRPDHAAFRPLMSLLDDLIGDLRDSETKHGSFTRDELHEAGARIVRENGRELIQFPIRWPWKVPPDPKRGIAGVRGDPIYRAPHERGPQLESFRTVRQSDVRPPDEDWDE